MNFPKKKFVVVFLESISRSVTRHSALKFVALVEPIGALQAAAREPKSGNVQEPPRRRKIH
jgi:hypothetical protein